MPKILNVHETAKVDNNRIINGSFDYWQRGTSFVSPASATYVSDRWLYGKNGAMVHTVSRSTDVPSGAFGQYSILLDVTTINANAATDFCFLFQRIEGNILRTFKDKKMVLSFWVKSPKAGIHCVAFRNGAGTRTLVKEYTVDVANTWEKKTVRITHDSSGTWTYDNTNGIELLFTLVVGSSFQVVKDTWQNSNAMGTSAQVNVCDNTANNFYLTDVCLVEDNESQTLNPNFVLAGRDVFEELQLCQRYYEKSYDIAASPGSASTINSVQWWGQITTASPTIDCRFLVNKRATPSSVVIYNANTGATGSANDRNGNALRAMTVGDTGIKSFTANISSGYSGLTQLSFNWAADAEL